MRKKDTEKDGLRLKFKLDYMGGPRDEVLFLKDYLSFGSRIRFFNAEPLYERYIKEEREELKRLYITGIYLQLMLVFEDAIGLFVAFAEKHLKKIRIYETIAREIKGKEIKDFIESLESNTMMARTGLSGYKKIDYDKYDFITKTVTKKSLDVIKSGTIRILDICNQELENFNKIKHVLSAASSPQAYGLSIDGYNNHICTLKLTKEQGNQIVGGYSLIENTEEFAKGMLKNIAGTTDVMSEAIIIYSLIKYPRHIDEIREMVEIMVNDDMLCSKVLEERYSIQYQ